MAKGFFYTGGAPTANDDYNQTLATTPDAFYTVTKPTPSNIDTFDLGYGHLTIADYAEYLYRKTAASPPGTPTSIAIPYVDLISHTGGGTTASTGQEMNFIVNRTADNTFTITIQAQIAQMQGVQQSGTVSIPTGDDYSTFKAKFQQLFQASFNDMLLKMPGKTLFLPWEKNVLFNYTGKTQELIAKYGAEAKTRAARNQAIQSFLDSSKSRKDIISDKQDQQQRIIDSASSARKQSSNILGAILHNLKSILASIYK